MRLDDDEQRQLKQLVRQLIEFDEFGDERANGIARLVAEEGEDWLSTKQQKVHERYVRPMLYPSCSVEVCREEIPFCDVIASMENDGRCSLCEYRLNKDNR